MNKTAAGLALAALALIAGCSSASPRPTAEQLARRAIRTDLARSAGSVQNIETGQVLRLGYPEDLASAPVLAGLETGLYRDDLGPVTLQPQPYASDIDEVTALEHGQLDAAYLDPVAAISAWQYSSPGSLHIVAGATTGPSELIARPGITRPAQLRGKRVEAPYGSSQDAALAAWLSASRLTGHISLLGSSVTTVGILQQFKAGTVAAAFEPQPLAQQLIAAGGHPLAASPAGTVTAVLVVTQRYLTANPAAVRDLLNAQAATCAQFTARPATAWAAATTTLSSDTGVPIPATLLAAATRQLTCTTAPDRASIQTEARQAAAAHITQPAASLTSLYDLINAPHQNDR